MHPETQLPSIDEKQQTKIENIQRAISRFISTPGLLTLLGNFGYTEVSDPTNPARDNWLKLRRMSRFASTQQQLNPRRGNERTDAESLKLSETDPEVILEIATNLNMVEGNKPSKNQYQALVALGAGGAHALERTAYLKENGVTGDTIYCVAGDIKYSTAAIAAMKDTPSPRTDSDSQNRRQAYINKMLSLKEQYQDNVPEFEFMLAAAEATYGELQNDGHYRLGKYTEEILENGDRKYTYPKTNNRPEIVIIEVHNKTKPNKRTRSEDTNEALLHELQSKNQNNVLMSTTAIFMPFQHTIAQRMLTIPHDISVETIGFPTERTPTFNKPEKYIQEITAAIIEHYKLARSLIDK